MVKHGLKAAFGVALFLMLCTSATAQGVVFISYLDFGVVSGPQVICDRFQADQNQRYGEHLSNGQPQFRSEGDGPRFAVDCVYTNKNSGPGDVRNPGRAECSPLVTGMAISMSTLSCSCPSGQRYFSDVNKCVAVTPAGVAPRDPKDNGPSCPVHAQAKQPSCGNPINPGSGNKVQQEIDFDGPTTLPMSRTYNGGFYNGDPNAKGGFGAWWTHPFERRLKIQAVVNRVKCYSRNDTGAPFCENAPVPGAGAGVQAQRPGGKVYTFEQGPSGMMTDGDIVDGLTPVYASDGSGSVVEWKYNEAQTGAAERYAADGRLLSLTTRQGENTQLTYSTGKSNDSNVDRFPAGAPICATSQAGTALPPGLLLCVTDDYGRQINFEYDAKQRISKVISPSEHEYLYAYDGPSGGCATPAVTGNRACSADNLTQVTYPDGSVRTYHYNEAARVENGAACSATTPVAPGFGHLLHALTGIVDEEGNRFATWGYSCIGRAISSEHAGGTGKVTLTYGARSTDGSQTVTVSSYVGIAGSPTKFDRDYHFSIVQGTARNDSISQPCTGCDGMSARTYDANSNVSSAKDWNGSKTVFTYDLTRNLETSRTEASGTAQTRTTTTVWHPTFALPTKTAAPLLITSYSYDEAGNLIELALQATTDASGAQGIAAPVTGPARKTAFTYDSKGRVLTIKSPLNEMTIFTYDEAGNLISKENAAGHMTTFANYDANGRAGKFTDPNGLVTTLTYTSRGKLESSSQGGETTSYSYNKVGQLVSVTRPDGNVLSYAYDAAQRLTSIVDGAGNSITYTLDLAGNRIEEKTTDTSGNLVRQVSRVFDSLNRLKQVTGATQ